MVKDRYGHDIKFSNRIGNCRFFMMTHYANCDVISGQNIKFKLKYLVNERAQKYKRTCITALKVLSNNTIKIFVS